MLGGALWILLATGLAAGFISGLMGVGGGILMTPVLHYALELPWPDAVALSLLVIAVQSPVGIWRHHRRRVVSARIAWPLIAGGGVGVVAGVWLEPRIGVPWLKLAFAVLMLAAGHRLIDGRAPTAQGRPTPSPPGPAPLAGLGVAAGIVSRLLGVGGGIVTVPMLSLGGVAPHVAVGTSLVAVFTNAAVASSINLAQGLDWTAGIPLAIAAVAGAPLGVRAAHALPERGLRVVVAGGLVAVAFAVLFDALAGVVG